LLGAGARSPLALSSGKLRRRKARETLADTLLAR
jgi:hypothetical protein